MITATQARALSSDPVQNRIDANLKKISELIEKTARGWLNNQSVVYRWPDRMSDNVKGRIQLELLKSGFNVEQRWVDCLEYGECQESALFISW